MMETGKKIEDIIEEVVILSEFGRKIVDAESRQQRNGRLV